MAETDAMKTPSDQPLADKVELPTPRTDAATRIGMLKISGDNITEWSEEGWVPVKIARQLERELSTARSAGTRTLEITEVVGADGKGVAAPCAISGCALAHGKATLQSASERIEPKKDWGRAQVGLDGNCGYALLGADLQSGVAEFVEIEGWPQPTYKQERAAWGKALAKLEERLGSGPLRYEVIR